MDNWVRLDEDKRRQLAQEKMAARKQLLAMSPLKAQEITALSVHSSHWSVALENLTWDESLSLIDDPTDS